VLLQHTAQRCSDTFIAPEIMVGGMFRLKHNITRQSTETQQLRVESKTPQRNSGKIALLAPTKLPKLPPVITLPDNALHHPPTGPIRNPSEKQRNSTQATSKETNAIAPRSQREYPPHIYR